MSTKSYLDEYVHDYFEELAESQYRKEIQFLEKSLKEMEDVV